MEGGFIALGRPYIHPLKIDAITVEKASQSLRELFYYNNKALDPFIKD
jgi:hypothetical protein